MALRVRPRLPASLGARGATGAAIGVLIALGAAGRAGAAPLALADGDGLHVTAVTQVDARRYDVAMTTAALTGTVRVSILLPRGYVAGAARRYPVLYLLTGTSGGASDWATFGQAEQTTAPYPMIVVSPDIDVDGSGGGWCANAWGGGAGGPPAWETFHVDQLIPWIDGNLDTLDARRGRAIVGLSQGGFCALSYAARHPDLFSIAGSFSGADDIAFDPLDEVEAAAITDLTAIGLDHTAPDSFFGPSLPNPINWQDHDPTTLAENLADTRLFEYTGDGRPGPLDRGLPDPESMIIEAGAGQMTIDFHARLRALGIADSFSDYGPGTHTWPYWTRDLRSSIGRIAADFADPPADPAAVTYTIADPSFSVYGWSVRLTPGGERFTTLAGADARGFSLRGTGTATVTTPPSYPPAALVPTSLGAVRADASGRLILTVPLDAGEGTNRVAIDAPGCAGARAGRRAAGSGRWVPRRPHRPLAAPVSTSC